MPEDYEGEFWFCVALGEAWNLEVHEQTPCDLARGMYGDSPGEHDRCGPRTISRKDGDA